MAFTVFYSVRGAKEEIPQIILAVQRLGIESLESQPGFRHARLMVAEDLSEAVFLTDWDSRDDFLAYRGTELGQRIVGEAMKLHPQLSFYDHVATYETKPE